jgi:hypothetical protein
MSSRVSWFRSISFAEFRRYDHFPETRVAILLPAIQDFRRRDGLAPIVKSATRTVLGCALTGDVAAVCSPLAGDSFWREHNADRAALLERPPTTPGSSANRRFAAVGSFRRVEGPSS